MAWALHVVNALLAVAFLKALASPTPTATPPSVSPSQNTKLTVKAADCNENVVEKQYDFHLEPGKPVQHAHEEDTGTFYLLHEEERYEIRIRRIVVQETKQFT